MFKCREAREDDVEEVVDLLREFHCQSPYKEIHFNTAATEEYVKEMIETGVVVLAEDELFQYPVGVLGFDYGSLPFNPHYYLFNEKFFYVRPVDRDKGIGKSLLEYAEELIREMDVADAVVLGTNAESPPHLKAFLTNQNYKEVESLYIKEI
jgi:N-acetylglutamate synthase-like GNAT family acetyltransferase